MTYSANEGKRSTALTVFTGPYIKLTFQDGPIKEHGVNGTTNEEIIQLLISRIQSLDFIVKSEHNAVAIDCLQEALGALLRRTQNREARGVEGTMRP